MTGRAIAICGGVLVLAMTILMLLGTTSVGLFLTYGVLWVAGGGVLTWGLRREKAETFARLERQRRSRS